MDRPPLIEAEIVPPGASYDGPPPPVPNAIPRVSAISEPFHPAATALLILVDNLWMLPEFLVATLWVTVPLCFLSVFLVTLTIQRNLAGNSRSVATAKAMFFGLVAALPFSVTGTTVGLAFLAWAGVKRLSR